jgi:ATP-dependent DNA ligase
VVKNPGSIYEPGARNHSWVKVKPDYIDELQDNCDLLIVGMLQIIRTFATAGRRNPI